MLKRLFVILFLSMLSVAVNAQQTPMYTQYMFNGLLINPAYAGIDDMISVTAQSRVQWLGFDGSPETHTFSGHTPLKNELISGGFIVMRDKIGVTKQTAIATAWSYKVLFKKTTLSLGMQAGMTNVNLNLNTVELPDPNDPFFAGSEVNSWVPNFGVGLFYYSSKYYLSASIPHFVNNPVRKTRYKQIRHYFITGGYVFDLNEDFKLKPNFLIKAVSGIKVQVDLNMNLSIHNIFWVGASYRTNESLGLILEYNINDHLRVGYSYDAVIFALNRKPSHEIMLNYRFSISKNKVVEKPYNNPKVF